ncbi:MAG TPA: gliding motility lipoprotein GldH [Chitinophagaceae bacterium]|nr:gliding motility lipoprotein GldH [Chitinophagaceae bacterium]
MPLKRIFYACLILCTASCSKLDSLRVFEQNTPIPEYAWRYRFRPSFQVAITDTLSYYTFYVTIRHTDAYPYSNIWLLITSRYPGEKDTTSRVELPLADPDGRWMGSGMDDIFSQRVLIRQHAILSKPGNYTFTFQQDMRQNPLPHVLSVGLRIEKAGSRQP